MHSPDSEFDILKANHKFLREHPEPSADWNDQLAAKYYANLYREFALCDLKHYKSGNFALRWRTEDEVISGAGEETCANTRCPHHTPQSNSPVPLTILELPFVYQEHGESKSALVKVSLCARCLKKLLWKKTKEREGPSRVADPDTDPKQESSHDQKGSRHSKKRRRDSNSDLDKPKHRRRSRSKSPRARRDTDHL